mmetsp:Transcript_14936/g.25334  ORF Transcript_14936/g.25334 Transcript_14936/m.25334 type:complete len:242 (-) Transcript_14936:211-936(-)
MRQLTSCAPHARPLCISFGAPRLSSPEAIEQRPHGVHELGHKPFVVLFLALARSCFALLRRRLRRCCYRRRCRRRFGRRPRRKPGSGPRPFRFGEKQAPLLLLLGFGVLRSPVYAAFCVRCLGLHLRQLLAQSRELVGGRLELLVSLQVPRGLRFLLGAHGPNRREQSGLEVGKLRRRRRRRSCFFFFFFFLSGSSFVVVAHGTANIDARESNVGRLRPPRSPLHFLNSLRKPERFAHAHR